MAIPLPLFYFKPTICWVDDDRLFLDAVSALFSDTFNCFTFTQPEKAVEFLSAYKAPLSEVHFTRDFTESDAFGTNDHLPVDLNISAITQLATLSQKVDEIAILVVDYNMPSMTGLDVCNKLKGTCLNKVLLTGETNHLMAVEAFNQGLINKFIQKDLNIAEKLKEYIHELSYSYFYKKTENIISHLEASRLSVLTDPIFINFFYHWQAENQIEEFYLINKQGSFLVKNKNGESAYFIVMSDFDRAEFIHLNNEDITTSADLAVQLSQGDSVPFFGLGKEPWEFDFNQWGNYCYPAQVIQGRENYYWAVVKA